MDCDRLVELDPRDPFAYYMRGGVLSRLAKYEAAVQDFGSAIELDPEATDFYYQRGKCRVELGEYASAIEDFDEAERLAPGSPLVARDRENAVRLAKK